MKCQNCGENEANVKYTQIINGVKKQMNLCEECAKELGIDKIQFDMPMSFTNMWEDMFDLYDDMFEGFPFMSQTKLLNDYSNNIDQNTNMKVDIRNRTAVGDRSAVKEDIQKFRNKKAEESKDSAKQIEILKKRLEKEIKEERFEDAAKTRDEIKKLSE